MSEVARHAVAVELLDLGPADRVLDIGCGHGVATALALGLVPEGRVTALDRSPKMLDAVRRRLRPELEQGRLDLVLATIAEADLPVGGFDAALAINVAGLIAGPTGLDAVAHALAPGGRLAFVFEPPSTDDVPDIDRAARLALEGAGFVLTRSAGTRERVAIVGCRPDR